MIKAITSISIVLLGLLAFSSFGRVDSLRDVSLPADPMSLFRRGSEYIDLPYNLSTREYGTLSVAGHITEDSLIHALREISRLPHAQLIASEEAMKGWLIYALRNRYFSSAGYAYILLALRERLRGEYIRSLDLLEMGLPFCQEAARLSGVRGGEMLVMWYGQAAGVLQLMGRYEDALNYSLKAIKEYDNLQLANDNLRISLMTNAGMTYGRYGEWSKAIQYIDEAERLALLAGDSSSLATIYNSKAVSYSENNKLDSAYTYFKYAFKYSHKKRDPLLTKAICANLSALLLKREEYPEAVFYVNLGLGLDTFETKTISDVYLQFVLGQVYYFYYKNYQKAVEAYEIAIAGAKAIQATGYLDQFYNKLAMAYGGMRDYKNAYKYKDSAMLAYQEAADKKQLQSVNELEAKYQRVKQEQEVTRKNFIIAANEKELRLKNMLIGGVSLVCTLLLVLLWILWKNRRNRHKGEMLQALLEGEENERRRIAEDLHDGVGQIVSLLKIRLMAFEHTLPLNAGQKQRFENLMQLVDHSSAEIRQVSYNLTPKALETANLNVALKELAAATNSKAMRVSIFTDGLDVPFHSFFERSIYRIVQECVHNAVKHSSGDKLDIAAIREHKVLNITIEDNGRGFDPEGTEPTGLGLKNIQKRARTLKGKIELDSAKGRGTVVCISVPVRLKTDV